MKTSTTTPGFDGQRYDAHSFIVRKADGSEVVVAREPGEDWAIITPRLPDVCIGGRMMVNPDGVRMDAIVGRTLPAAMGAAAKMFAGSTIIPMPV